jgi:hypothetical protein
MPRAEPEAGVAMPILKYILMILGLGIFGSSASLVVYDIYLSEQLRRLNFGGTGSLASVRRGTNTSALRVDKRSYLT